jgi:Phosphate-induced protein 1 conserved region
VISFRALKYLSAASLLLSISVPAVAQVARGRASQELNEYDRSEQMPNGKGWGQAHDRQDASFNAVSAAPADAANRSDGMEPRGYVSNAPVIAAPAIKYHGGPVMLGTTNVYFIWYGDWSGDHAAQNLLPEFARSLGGSKWYNINTTYLNKSKQRVSNSVHFGGNAFNTSSYKTLNDANVQTIVLNAIKNGSLPKDSHGVYFVLTAPDVKETSGFCTNYCGWHSHALLNGTDVKFAFVGDASKQCASACEEQTTRSPNADPGVDGMASVLAHELSEAVTDPDLNAWYDAQGDENADKCAWTFGSTFTANNGSKANVHLGTRDWLVQQNWVNSGAGYCAKSH